MSEICFSSLSRAASSAPRRAATWVVRAILESDVEDGGGEFRVGKEGVGGDASVKSDDVSAYLLRSTREGGCREVGRILWDPSLSLRELSEVLDSIPSSQMSEEGTSEASLCDVHIDSGATRIPLMRSCPSSSLSSSRRLSREPTGRDLETTKDGGVLIMDVEVDVQVNDDSEGEGQPE